MREQAEQPLDARPGAAQVLGRVRLVERLARGDQQLFVGCKKDGLAPGPAARSARAAGSDRRAPSRTRGSGRSYFDAPGARDAAAAVAACEAAFAQLESQALAAELDEQQTPGGGRLRAVESGED